MNPENGSLPEGNDVPKTPGTSLALTFSRALERSRKAAPVTVTAQPVVLRTGAAARDIEQGIEGKFDAVPTSAIEELAIQINRGNHRLAERFKRTDFVRNAVSKLGTVVHNVLVRKFGTDAAAQANVPQNVDVDTAELEDLDAKMTLFTQQIVERLGDLRTRHDVVNDLGDINWQEMMGQVLDEIAAQEGLEAVANIAPALQSYFDRNDENSPFVGYAVDQIIAANDDAAIQAAYDGLDEDMCKVLCEAMEMSEQGDASTDAEKRAVLEAVRNAVYSAIIAFRENIISTGKVAMLMFMGGQPMDADDLRKIRKDGVSAYLKDNPDTLRVRVLTQHGFEYVHPNVSSPDTVKETDKNIAGALPNGKDVAVSARVITRQMMLQGLMDMTNAMTLDAELREADGTAVKVRILGNVAETVTVKFDEGFKMLGLNPGEGRQINPANPGDKLLNVVLQTICKWGVRVATPDEASRGYQFPVRNRQITSPSEEQTIEAGDVGEMPKEILEGNAGAEGSDNNV